MKLAEKWDDLIKMLTKCCLAKRGVALKARNSRHGSPIPTFLSSSGWDMGGMMIGIPFRWRFEHHCLGKSQEDGKTFLKAYMVLHDYGVIVAALE